MAKTLFDEQSEAIQNSANIQAAAISAAAAIQKQIADESIAFQKEQNQIARDVLNPFVTAGSQSSQRLKDLLGIGGSDPAAFRTLEQNYQKQFAATAKEQFQAMTPTADFMKVPFINRVGAQALLNEKDFNVEKANEWLRKNGLPELDNSLITKKIGEAPVYKEESAVEAQQRVMDEILGNQAFQREVNFGVQTLDKSQAALGSLKSGRLVAGMQDYGQRSANSYIQQQINNLQQLSSQGVGAAGGSAQLAQTLGQNVSSTMMESGKQQANYNLGLGQLAAATNLAQSPAAEMAFNIAVSQAMAGKAPASSIMQAGGAGIAGAYGTGNSGYGSLSGGGFF